MGGSPGARFPRAGPDRFRVSIPPLGIYSSPRDPILFQDRQSEVAGGANVVSPDA